MPVYCYRRPDGVVEERFFFVQEGIPPTVLCEDRVLAKRSIQDEHPAQKPRGGGLPPWPMRSRAMGIHPSQIPEAKRRFPQHQYTPTGEMILESPQHRKQCLGELGLVDLDGNDSGRN
jgi:hypothetical protein